MPNKTPDPPYRTYISKDESERRNEWYLRFKKRPILDAIVDGYYPGQKEREYFYYSDPTVISAMFGDVLADEKYTGIRIYLGSCDGTPPEGCDPHDKGRLVLIFVPTIVKADDPKADNDSGEYYKLRMGNCSRVTLTKDVFDTLVHNYVEKKNALQRTLSISDRDSTDANEETRHLFIDTVRIKEIYIEINYQLKMSVKHGVSGIKVYINSYTDVPVFRDELELCQRLTVQFVFTDDAGKDVDLKGIDDRYDKLPKFLLGYNTIDPTPPYP